MDLSTLKSHIKTGQFLPTYVFTGEEVKIMDMYIDMISKKASLSIVRSDSLSEVYQQIKAKTLIQMNYLYIIRDDKDFLSDEKLWSKMGIDSTLQIRQDNNIVIFYYTDIDKRTKFFKRFGDTIVVFNPLEKNVLLKYIKKEISLSDKNAERLIELCEYSYNRILLEIDKIKHCSSSTDYDKTFETLLKDGAIYKPPKDAIFDFAKAVLDRDIDATWDLMNQCYEIGEANMVMLSVLYTYTKQLLQIQSCYKDHLNIVETTGLNGFQIKNVKDYVNRYNTSELVNMMRYIRKAEKGIKTGEIPDDISIQYVLVNCI